LITVAAGADDRSDAKHRQERRVLGFIGLLGGEVLSEVNRRSFPKSETWI
jgi:hypothetical protein